MKIHNLVQGSDAWLAYRASHFNASDAPAMLGLSEYKTRTQLLHELHTGMAPEVDGATQRIFNSGHRFEALARPLAEEFIGQELYPVVGSEGKLSASLDGLTMAEDINFEHKTLNANLRAIMVDGCTGADLDMQYKVQMEQQMMISGASKTLFMASQWAAQEDELIEERHCWYYPDYELRQQILQGWTQFAIDLAAYVPPKVIVPAIAAPQMGLPAVLIKVEGSIALVDNLPEIGMALNAYIARINKKPETDQDFANLEATVKGLKAFEEALGASEENALAQVGSVDAMRKTVALYRELASSNRLLVDKLVKAEKENRRIAIVSDAVAELVTHVKKLNERLGKPYMPGIAGDFQGVIKGLKSLDSMKDKVSGELARCKILANEAADRILTNLETKGLHGYAFLFADIAALCLKASDDFQNTVTARITAHEAAEAAKEEATRARIQAEEREKAEREARAKLAAEQVAFEAQEHEEIARLANLNATMVVEAVPVVTHATVVEIMMPPAVRQAMAPKADTAPTLTLGEISARFGFNVTSAFLATLGFEATTVKAAKLFHAEDFDAIGRAIIEHIENVCMLQAA
jgi:predicted phage-related endonuclease